MAQELKLITVLALITVLVSPSNVRGNDADHDPLFYIERNKNANIVQYDARLGKDGLLHPKQPVVAYWIRHAERGQVEDLSWIQDKFAYGFKAKLNKSENTVILDMAVNIGRTIMVKRDGEDYRATTDINGVTCYVDKIFIHASGKGMATRVDDIELFGTAVHNNTKQHEHLSP